ncbi:MAG: hypothetical protein ACQETE_01535 [Bacteroidota bacterium]
MDQALIAVISASGVIIGAGIKSLFDYFSNRETTTTEATSNLVKQLQEQVQTLSNQVDNTSTRVNQLEKVVNYWKGNYWSLYMWVTKLAKDHDIDAFPPAFHKDPQEDEA